MNNKALTLSLLMAGIAVLFVQSYVSSIEEETKKKFGTEVTVLVARKDIKEMETLVESMVEIKNIPKNYLEPGAIHFEAKSDEEKQKKQTQSFREVVGTVAIVPVKAGEQISANKITDPSLRTGLAPQVAPGRRAVSIPVDDTRGVSKLIKPGDRVDLIAVVGSGGNKDEKIAKTILQDIVILSIGKYIANNVARVVETDAFGGKDKIRSLAEDFSFPSVTVEVDPPQAQAIALILASGDSFLMLSLRNNDDIDRQSFPGTMLSDVIGGDFNRLKGVGGKK